MAMAMGRWVVETTTALACPAEAATTVEALRSCSIIHTYSSHPRPSLWRHTLRRERDTGHEWVRARSKDQPWPWVGG